uniref:Fucosyltransferase n=1 Tax=Culicoides sonorensis TaxID=179676 RepID=A0A336LTI5_CULSO
MRFRKIYLKNCFTLIIGFAIVLLFFVVIREKDIFRPKLSSNNYSNGKTKQTHIDMKAKEFLFKEAYPTEFEINSIDMNVNINKNIKNYIKGSVDGNSQKINDKINSVDEISDSDDSTSIMKESIDGSISIERPWYFDGGTRYPKPATINKKTKKRIAKLFPSEDPLNDRITNQLMFVPPNYQELKKQKRFKTILLYNGLGAWNVKEGRNMFINSKCPVNTCKITGGREHAAKADLILYKDYFIPTGVERHPSQIFMLYLLECPYHTPNIKFPDSFNWTATYRRDSDIVAPYEKWEYYDPRIKQIEQDRNYALNKTKKVAWFVSNCGARNGRLQFAHELQKYIDVDIYGFCGEYKCPRSNAEKCFEVLDHDYKFYLAFENSNCKDYITEKFFVNALGRNILPIVMGARPEDYALSAPHRSYIHVDEFTSAKELAEYLHMLDKNDELYNSYFKWKGTGEFINTYFWCRVCAMLHDDEFIKKPGKCMIPDINEWWRAPGVCTNGSWRKEMARKEIMGDD